MGLPIKKRILKQYNEDVENQAKKRLNSSPDGKSAKKARKWSPELQTIEKFLKDVKPKNEEEYQKMWYQDNKYIHNYVHWMKNVKKANMSNVEKQKCPWKSWGYCNKDCPIEDPPGGNFIECFDITESKKS